MELPLPLATAEKSAIDGENLKAEVGIQEKARPSPSASVLKIPIRGGAVLEQDQVSNTGLHHPQRGCCSKRQCNGSCTVFVNIVHREIFALKCFVC